MAKRGPAKIPTALKQAHNLPSLKNINPNEPKVEAITHTPPAPEHLAAYAQAEWARIAPFMVDVGMLTELDLAPLAAYCECVSTFQTCTEIMNELAKADPVTRGLVVRSPGGAAYMNPVQAVKQAAMRDMVRYAAELGLTPAGRASIVVSERGGMGRAVPGGGARGQDIAAKYNL